MAGTQTNVSVEPLRLTRYADELSTNVRRVVAYHGRCGCGWLGPWRATYGLARADQREHAREHRGRDDG